MLKFQKTTLISGMLFSILLFSNPTFAQNDLCADAITIACGQTLSGSTTSATADPLYCVGNNTAPGVWYTFTGANSNDPGAAVGSAGDHILLSTCGQAEYDTKIDVFEGSCGALTCVAGGDDPHPSVCNGGQAMVNFPTIVGTTYYVMVSGKDAAAFGGFDITMSCGPAETGPVVLVPQSGINYVPCGNNVTLRDAGDLGNYPNNNSGYTVLEAGPYSTINISGSLAMEDDVFDIFYILTGDGLEAAPLWTYNSFPLNVTLPQGESAIVFFSTNGSGSAAGFDLTVTYSGACEVAANEDCANAVPLICGQTVSGHTYDASVEPVSCMGNNTAPGVWYTFTGANSNDPGAAVGSAGDHILLSTCGQAEYDTKIDVFEGSCGALTCVAGGDDPHPSVCNGGQAMVNIPTIVGTTYYVLVSGKDAAAFGGFDITMSCGPAETGPVVLVPQSGINYVPCGNNVTLRDAGDLGNYPNNNSGYTVLEAGPYSTINISGSLAMEDDVFDIFYILTGDGLESAPLWTYNSFPLNVTLPQGESAIVYFSSDNYGNEAGFELNVTYSGACVPAPNDLCANATPISCGIIITDSTTLASADGAPDCFGINDTPGVWYTFTGQDGNDPLASNGAPGDLVTLTVCDTVHNIRIEVFEGDCNSLNCSAGLDFIPTVYSWEPCGLGAEVSFNTTVGATYYVLVSPMAPEAIGPFELSMSCDMQCAIAANADCNSAMPLPIAPYGTTNVISDDNTCVPMLVNNSIFNEQWPNIWSTWYSFNSGNETAVVWELTQLTMGTFFISLYEGSCTNWHGSSLQDDPGTWSSTFGNLDPNTDYFIEVGVYRAQDRGTFEIGLASNTPPPPANDECSGAIPVTIGTPVAGTTANANVLPTGNSACNIFFNGGETVWYTLTGVDGLMTASVCEYGLYPIIYSGSCGELTCANYSILPCSGGGNKVSWAGSADSTYFVAVTTQGSSSAGPFTLQVDTAVQSGFHAKTFLQGPYDQLTGLMHDSLRVNWLIPQSYGSGYIWNGSMLQTTGNDALVDWVTVELRDGDNDQSIVASKEFLIQRDGDIVTDQLSDLLVFDVPADDHYVSIQHRNHLWIMSAAPITLAGPVPTLNFTDGSTPTYGTDAQVDINGVKALWCGDVTGDGVIKYTGSGNDRDDILLEIGGIVPTNTTYGRRNEDVNMDGQVKYTGANNDRDIILQNIGGVVPTNTRVEQMP